MGLWHYGTEAPGVPGKSDDERWSRVNAYVDRDLAEKAADVIANLRKKHGIRVSMSHLVDIALRELLSRRDLPDVLDRHKAKPRRD